MTGKAKLKISFVLFPYLFWGHHSVCELKWTESMSNILVEPHPFPSPNNCHWPSVGIALRKACLVCLQRPGL